jgi:arabinan endo-1,5-alpha-L-arabinosidase
VIPTLPTFAAVRRAALGSMLALGLAACGGGGTRTTTAPIDTIPTPTSTQYLNPVLNADFPDPAVFHAPDRNYYAYATQTTGIRLQVARSSDLVAWTLTGEALPTVPTWTRPGSNFFAPDVEFRDGKYVMYFAANVSDAARTTAGDDFCIGMATSTSPTGPFVDVGRPVKCGSSFSTIDPMGFDDPQSGKRYLYWGSAGIPITVQELAADRASFAAGSSPISLVNVRGGSGGYDTGLIEGPWVTYHAPYYYLYFSGNNCCGAGARYAVMVARAPSPTGPFEVLKDVAGVAQTILAPSTKWLAPGHNSVVTDGAGVEWMLYHAIDAANPYLIPGNTSVSRRPMLIDRITYANGWPTVGTAGVPTSTPQTRPTP